MCCHVLSCWCGCNMLYLFSHFYPLDVVQVTAGKNVFIESVCSFKYSVIDIFAGEVYKSFTLVTCYRVFFCWLVTDWAYCFLCIRSTICINQVAITKIPTFLTDISLFLFNAFPYVFYADHLATENASHTGGLIDINFFPVCVIMVILLIMFGLVGRPPSPLYL